MIFHDTDWQNVHHPDESLHLQSVQGTGEETSNTKSLSSPALRRITTPIPPVRPHPPPEHSPSASPHLEYHPFRLPPKGNTGSPPPPPPQKAYFPLFPSLLYIRVWKIRSLSFATLHYLSIPQRTKHTGNRPDVPGSRAPR